MATRRDDPEVFRITDAGPALSDDQAGRTRRYLISMTVRTVCFVGAVVASGWLRWVLLLGAVVLPYVAVVVANAGRESGRRRRSHHVVMPPPGALGDGRVPPAT